MRSVLAVGAVAVVAFATAGCTVHARGRVAEEPVGTTYVTSAPVDNYAAYPHTTYEGREVYYVHDRWGYPENGRWREYHSEPPPLVRYRTTVRQAPPAHPREREYVQPAPHAPPASAPPAVQVR